MAKYVEVKKATFGPYQVVSYFEERLNAGPAPNPIHFTEGSGLPKQRTHAKRLLTACKYSVPEVRAIIEEYCRDEWLKTNRACLSAVVKQADEMRARIARRQQGPECSWEDLR